MYYSQQHTANNARLLGAVRADVRVSAGEESRGELNALHGNQHAATQGELQSQRDIAMSDSSENLVLFDAKIQSSDVSFI